MPMIVDLDAPPVEPSQSVTSPDGWFRAVLDEAWAGVVLAVDYKSPPDTARNLALNPSATTDLSNTSGYGANMSRARVTTQAYVGASAVQHTHSGTTIAGGAWSIEPVAGGQTVTAGVWVKLPASGIVRGNLSWRSGSTTLQTQALTPPTSGEWTLVTGSYTLGAGETCDNIGLSWEPTTVGTQWWADAMMVETGPTLRPYVDGYQPGCMWEGTPDASPSRRVTSVLPWQDIRKVLIERQDPGAAAPVPVRSANTAWAVEGIGQAYDHEAPLGVGVAYTARPQYADGTWGPTSSLGIELPAPDPVADVWIKSLDEPGVSARVTVVSWPELAWAARIDQAQVAGSPFPAAAQDVYSAATSTITLDAAGTAIEAVRELLTTPGVRLLQTRPGYRRPDMFVMFSDPAESVDATPDGARTFSAGVVQVDRPDTTGQRLRMPGWSYDALAAQYATYDAVAASYPTYQSLALHGVL